MTHTVERQRECTPEEAQLWQARFGDGLSHGHSDGRWNREPRIPLMDQPADIPGECGAQYVARHVAIAWELGYSHAYLWEMAHRTR